MKLDKGTKIQIENFIEKEKSSVSPSNFYNQDKSIEYYFGIIDTLTYFSSKKRGEFMIKRVF